MVEINNTPCLKKHGITWKSLSELHFALLFMSLCMLKPHSLPEENVVKPLCETPSSCLTYSSHAFIPDSLKNMLKEGSWFIVEDNNKLWIYDSETWQKVSNNLTNSEQKALEHLISMLKKKNVPSSVKNRRPMKLRKYDIHFLPENFY